MKLSKPASFLIALLLLLTSAVAACAATLTIPSFTVTSAPSTAITCSAISSSLQAPVAAGTVLTACTVTPSTWTGVVTVNDSRFLAANLSGNAFNLSVGSTPLAAGTYSGITVTSSP